MGKIILGILVVVGMFIAPFMTMGAVMIHYNHTILGGILVFLGVIHMVLKLIDD